MHAQPGSGRSAARLQLLLERFGHADQHDVDVIPLRLEFERCGNGHMGAVVTAHAIDRYRDQD
jgi:hypothetical protein